MDQESQRRPRRLACAVATAMTACLAISSAVAAEPDGTAFLWRVRSRSTTLHLLGSVHVMKPDAYPLSPVIEQAFAGASVTVFEVELDQAASGALRMLAEGTLPEGQSLRDVVSEDTYRMVVRRLEQLDLDIGGFQQMRPWLLALTLTTFEMARAGYAQSEGVDAHLFQRAREAGKTIVALETVEYQVGLFAGFAASEDEEFLRHTLLELDTVIPELEELLDHWQRGSVVGVERLLTEAFQEFPQLYGKMVTDRNRSWLPVLERLLAGDQPAMAVVGALHLVGEDGLVELLRRRGFRVEQL